MRVLSAVGLAFFVLAGLAGCDSPAPEPSFHIEGRPFGHGFSEPADAGVTDSNQDTAAHCVAFTGIGCVHPTPDDQDGDRSPRWEDCDDLDYGRSPWRNDQPCNGFDEDCDGIDNCGPTDRDSDGDPDESDCAPDDPTIAHRGFEIVCDGIDQTCDGLDPCDRDGDFDPESTDCDDADPGRHHLLAEVFCDEIDQNCDGADCCAQDVDGDGYACREDCDDGVQRIHPGAEPSTACDGEDRDCDGAPDGWERCGP